MKKIVNLEKITLAGILQRGSHITAHVKYLYVTITYVKFTVKIFNNSIYNTFIL